MPHGALKILPGVDTVKTPALNEAAISQSQLIRFLPDRQGFGLPQKMGGWVKYYPNTIESPVRALHAWSDLNTVKHLAVGAESSLSVISNGNRLNITPTIEERTFTPDFTTTLNSAIVNVVDTGSDKTNFDYVYFLNPVSVGGLILQGPYPIVQVNTVDDYDINVGTPATSAISNAGDVREFVTINGSSVVTCNFDNHGLGVGSIVEINSPVLVGGITLLGIYSVATVASANQFTFNAQNAATSGDTVFENSGDVKARYYTTYNPPLPPQGFGENAYGAGGYGTGTAPSGNVGTPITATDWTLDNWGQILLANPRGGAIYYWNPSGPQTVVQIIAGSAPTANLGMFVAMPQRQVIAYGSSFNNQIDPLLIRWCDVENFEEWIANTTNQAGSFRLPTGSRIVGAMQTSQQALFWTDVDLYAMQYVGYPLVYSFNKISTECGLISQKAVGTAGPLTFWMGYNQFFILSGEGAKVIQCPVWDVVFQNLNRDHVDKIRCATNAQFGEVTWFYPSSSSTEIDSYVKYNSLLDAWDYGTLGRTAWIDQSELGNPIGAGVDKYIYQHEIGNDADTQPMQPYMQTGYFVIAEGDQLLTVDQVWPDMKWGDYDMPPNATVNLTFYGVNYPGETPTVYGPYQMTQQTKYLSVRIRNRLLSIRIASNDFGTFWRMGAMRYRFQPDGKY